MSLPHSTLKSMEAMYARLDRQAEHERMNAELQPLRDLWGETKFQEWLDIWIDDSMTVDQIIATAHKFIPECTCNPINEPCPACREWARARARMENENG